jgi:hypothetical protein
MVAYTHSPLKMGVEGRAFWAARYLKSCTFRAAGALCNALAAWYFCHYHGTAQIGVFAPLHTIEFPPVNRMN